MALFSLAQQGVSLYKICKWLGHSDIKVTQIYAHFAPIYDKDIEQLSIEQLSACAKVIKRLSKDRRDKPYQTRPHG